MNCRFKLAAGMATIALLALTAGVCLASQGSAGDGSSAVTELLRLLRAKGVITGEEAGELEKKFDHGSPGSDKAKDKSVSPPAGKTAKTTLSASSDDKVMETIESLAGQSVISSDEKAELTVRSEVLNLGSMGKSVPDRQLHEVGAEEIDYVRTTVAVEEIRDQLRFLANRKVMTRDEAANAYRRFGNNYTAAEAVVTNDEKTSGKVPFAYGEVVENIDILAEQGIFSDNETDELKSRADLLNRRNNGDTVQERRRRMVGKGAIPYRRTTIEVDEVKDGLKFLTYQGIMTRGESTDAFARLEKKNPTDQLAENISDELAWEVRSQVAQKMDKVADLERKDAKLPEWLQRFKLYGDLRLRYQGEFFDKENDDIFNPAKPTELLNTLNDRHRMRIRARLGVLAKVTDGVDASIGLATGNTTDPVSTNQTLGDSLNKKTITLDTAYLKWTPLKGVTAWGGRIPNPWFSTDLVWDRDLNFDGVAVSYAPAITDSLGLFVTGGVFPLQEIELSQHDKWLFGGQLGVNYQPTSAINARLGVSYYRFENTQGRLSVNVADEFAYSVPLFIQKGNTYFDINRDFTDSTFRSALASKFHELNFTGSLDLGFWHPIHLVLMGDYVVNVGYNRNNVLQLTGTDLPKENKGYQFGLALGYPELNRFGDWRGYLNYRYLEADAVMDAFTDSDFHLGGTNAKGWTVGGDFCLTKNIWLSGKWITSGEISSENRQLFTISSEATGNKLDIDVFQFDINARF